jgi:hypothetical protein
VEGELKALGYNLSAGGNQFKGWGESFGVFVENVDNSLDIFLGSAFKPEEVRSVLLQELEDELILV